MKKYLLNMLMLSMLFIVGSSGALGRTLLEVGTADKPWTNANLATWTAGGTPTLADGIVTISGGNGSYETSKSLGVPSLNTTISLKAVWRGASSTGRAFSAGNGSYFRFGNIVVAQNDQDKKHGYVLTGLNNMNSVTTFGAGSYRVDVTSSTWLLIEAVINTETNVLQSFSIKSEDGTKEYVSLTDVAIEMPDYTVAFGYRKVGGVSTTNKEQLKSIVVTDTDGLFPFFETYDFGAWITANGVCNLTTSGDDIAQTGTSAKVGAVKVINNPTASGKTLELDGRFAVDYQYDAAKQIRFMWRSSGNAWQHGLAGQWNGNGSADEQGAARFSILNLKKYDKVKITYAVQSGKAAQPFTCKADFLSGVGVDVALVSGTSYTVTEDGNLDLYFTNNNFAISKVEITTYKDMLAEPVGTISGAKGIGRYVTLTSMVDGADLRWGTEDPGVLTDYSEWGTLYDGEFYTEVETIYAVASKDDKNSLVAEISTGAGTTLKLNTPTLTLDAPQKYTMTSDQSDLPGEPVATAHWKFNGGEEHTAEGTTFKIELLDNASIEYWLTAEGFDESDHVSETLSVPSEYSYDASKTINFRTSLTNSWAIQGDAVTVDGYTAQSFYQYRDQDGTVIADGRLGVTFNNGTTAYRIQQRYGGTNNYNKTEFTALLGLKAGELVQFVSSGEPTAVYNCTKVVETSGPECWIFKATADGPIVVSAGKNNYLKEIRFVEPTYTTVPAEGPLESLSVITITCVEGAVTWDATQTATLSDGSQTIEGTITKTDDNTITVTLSEEVSKTGNWTLTLPEGTLTYLGEPLSKTFKYEVSPLAETSTIVRFTDAETGEELQRDEIAYPGAKTVASTTKVFNRFMQIDGKWYEYTGKSYIADYYTNGMTYDIPLKEVKNLAVMFEAEDKSSTALDQGDFSGGKNSACAAENARDRGTSITLPAGTYEWYAMIVSNTNRGLHLRKANNATDPFVSMPAETGLHSAIFKLYEETTLYINGNNSGEVKTNQSANYDYTYIMNVNCDFDFDENTKEIAKGSAKMADEGIVRAPLYLGDGSVLTMSDTPEKAGQLWESAGTTQLYVRQGAAFTIANSTPASSIRRVIFYGTELNMTPSDGMLNNNVYEESGESRLNKAAAGDIVRTWTGNMDQVKFYANADLFISRIIVFSEDRDNETKDFVERGNPSANEVASIAELKELDEGSEARLLLNDAVVTYANGYEFYIEDATGAIMLSEPGFTLLQGQKLGEFIVGKFGRAHYTPALLKNSGTDVSTLTAKAGGEVKSTEMSITDAMDEANLCRFVKLTNVEAFVLGTKVMVLSGEDAIEIADEFGVGMPALARGDKLSSIEGILVMTARGLALAPVSSTSVVVDGATSIDASRLVNSEESIMKNGYDLSGRRVNDVRKGQIYIIDGKKVVK